MTRADLVASMAAASGWTKADADRALRGLLASVRASLKRGQPVTLVGFTAHRGEIEALVRG